MSVTKLTENQVLDAANDFLGCNTDGYLRNLQVNFEHGQFFVTDLDTGSQWSVVETNQGLELECICDGEE